MIPDWAITITAGFTVFVAVPALFLGSFLLPFFVVRKILKRPFTPLNILGCIIAAGVLIIADYYLLYWGFALLQGYAACSLYGC